MKIILCFVVTISVTTCFSQAEKETSVAFNRWIQKGDSLLQARNFSGAFNAYEKACTIDREHCPVEKLKFTLEQIENCADCTTPIRDKRDQRRLQREARKSQRKIKFL